MSSESAESFDGMQLVQATPATKLVWPADSELIGQSGRWSRREFLAGVLGVANLRWLRKCGQTKSRGNSEMTLQHQSTPSLPMMRAAIGGLLNSLNSEQRDQANLSFDDENRLHWHYVPMPREGISFKELDPTQRQFAHALLSASLSSRGLVKANAIISLEDVLREIEQGRGPMRDPELYYFALFGQPQPQKPWGWRIEGHHLSLNYAVINDVHVATTPCFFGANPGEVQHGPRRGLRVLAAEEDLARTLLKSLDDKQRVQAVISDSAPRDILSGNSRKAEAQQPAGIQASKLSGRQADILMSLLTEYVTRMPLDIAATRMEKLRAAGFGNIYFAWAGGPERGQPHYYRVQGGTFLLEYDNVQNNANHIHTVWRDFAGDFGLDLLAQHYQQRHR